MAKGQDSAKSAGDIAEATGNLVVSVGRLSLAMGLFTLRQAVKLLSAPATAAGSLDDVADAAGGQLTGIARTVFSVGANLQHGLVDATLDLSGVGPRGQAPNGSTSALSLSLPTAVSRRMTGIHLVDSGRLNREVAQDEFRRQLVEHQAEAARDRTNRERLIERLWKSEGLATTVARHLLPENTLNDPALPRQALPIIHVGFGSGSSESHMFDATRLNEVFAERCAPNYLGFAYEGIGALLRAYERGLFKLSAGIFGLVPFDAADGPDPENFFAKYLAQFPPDAQRQIAHGYGRLAAFSTPDVYRAIRDATKFPHDRVEPVVHGIAFAFAMMNRMDLPWVLRGSDVPFEPEVRAAFQNGLIYAMTFMEWFAPGMLAAWEPEARLELELVEHARREAARDLERGFPLASRLANPRR